MIRPLAILLVTLLVSSPLRAWDGHDTLMDLTLEGVEWLDAHDAIVVTPFVYEIEGIQPAYDFAFRGESVGDTLSAREILIRYAQEPDWGVDQNLRVSWQQRFMGGYTGFTSQAYFHLYYPTFTVHFPIPGIRMGAAHRRAALWYHAARVAFDRQDPYWGFRFLSMACHYVADVAQPFHSSQTSLKFVDWRNLIGGTTQITANYHFIYEEWVIRQIEDERAGRIDHGLSDAVRGAQERHHGDASDSVTTTARDSHDHFTGLVDAVVEFFDPRFGEPVEARAEEADLTQQEPVEPRDRMLEHTRPMLRVAGEVVRGLLSRARDELLGGDSSRRALAFLELYPLEDELAGPSPYVLRAPPIRLRDVPGPWDEESMESPAELLESGPRFAVPTH